ncbi:MAG: alpha/beta hydrolase [Burkholderiaceae bacterium]
MLNIVLVHGAFHGGWCWSETAAELTRRGARVFTPSLTGMGDRKHLFSPSITLATHVQDIVNLIEYERLDGCVLAGHSYAGNVITGVGDQLRDKVGHYIYVDASVPPDGTTTWGWASANPSQRGARMAMIDGDGQGMMLLPFPAATFAVTDPQQVADLEARLTPMPRGCYTEPIQLVNGGTEGLKRSYIAAANPSYSNMASSVQWVSKDPSWSFQEIDTGHDMMVTKPLELAAMLYELAAN